jgi:hypothetical protein
MILSRRLHSEVETRHRAGETTERTLATPPAGLVKRACKTDAGSERCVAQSVVENLTVPANPKSRGGIAAGG